MTRWMLLGMWAAIATSAAAGLWGISGIPKIDPETESLCQDLRRRMEGPAGAPPPSDQSLARVLRQLIDNGYVEQRTGHADRRQRLVYPTEKGRTFFEVLSSTQTSRIESAIASLPANGKQTVLRFFVGMVEPADRGVLDRLHLTDDI